MSLSTMTDNKYVTVTAEVPNSCRQIEHTSEVVCATELRVQRFIRKREVVPSFLPNSFSLELLKLAVMLRHASACISRMGGSNIMLLTCLSVCVCVQMAVLACRGIL